jgi:uncharacterized membrane protein YhhN
MLTKTEKYFSLVFFLIVIAELICDSYEGLTQFHYFTKPAIVIALLIFFWKQSRELNKSLRNSVVIALIFSVLGDILLLFVDVNPNYFMLGLVAFLLAHLMYVLAFLKHRNKTKKPFVFIVFLLVFASGLFYFLKDDLNAMLIPVIVYMAVILTMATTAFLRQGCVSTLSYNLVCIGALIFMLSDSILALNKFYQPLPLSNISIMTTYALAHYFIVIGILNHNTTTLFRKPTNDIRCTNIQMNHAKNPPNL